MAFFMLIKIRVRCFELSNQRFESGLFSYNNKTIKTNRVLLFFIKKPEIQTGETD